MIRPPPSSPLFPSPPLFRSQRSADDGAWQVALRILDLARRHGQVLPAAVGPQGREHRSPEAGEAAARAARGRRQVRSEEHTSELQSPCNLVCRLLLEKKKLR